MCIEPYTLLFKLLPPLPQQRQCNSKWVHQRPYDLEERTVDADLSPDAISGPVRSIIYNSSNMSSIALAYYGGYAISTFHKSLTVPSHLVPFQNFTFTLPNHPPRRRLRTRSHPRSNRPIPALLRSQPRHCPHLLLRPHNLPLRIRLLVSSPSSGPRHAVFWSPQEQEKYKPPNGTLFFLHDPRTQQHDY